VNCTLGQPVNLTLRFGIGLTYTAGHVPKSLACGYAIDLDR
jgi:hypothetical protein